MNQALPSDPILCLSVVNTKLRDYYENIEQLCQDLQVDKEVLVAKLKNIDYEYDAVTNQFI